MRVPSDTYLRGFAVRYGKSRSVEELAIPSDLQARALRLGLRRVACADRTLLKSLRIEAAGESVARFESSVEEIDRVIYTTSDFLQSEHRDELPELFNGLGLTRATPYGVFHGFCANFALVFEAAATLLATERARSILCLTSDLYWSDEGRVMRGNAGLGGDAAAAWIMSSAPGGFRLCSIGQAYAPRAVEFRDPSRLIDYVDAYANGFATACEKAIQGAHVARDQVRWLITPWFSDSVQRNLSGLAGIPLDRVHRGELEEYGHCNSADQIASLAAVLKQSVAGEYVLVTGAGEHMWAAAVLERVADVSSPATAEYASLVDG